MPTGRQLCHQDEITHLSACLATVLGHTCIHFLRGIIVAIAFLTNPEPAAGYRLKIGCDRAFKHSNTARDCRSKFMALLMPSL